jgi:arylsulfatase A-like enzyme
MKIQNSPLILMVAAGLAMATAHAAQQPNVLVYLADDFDFNEIGFFDPLRYPNWQSARAAGVVGEKKNTYGEFQTRPLTPHIDQLAKEGIVFDQFRITAPMCVPSRYALLTGQLPSRGTHWSAAAEQRDQGQRAPGPGLYLGDGQWQLAQAFRAAGYSTGLVGKWHLADWHERPGKMKTPFADHNRKTIRPGAAEDAEVAAEIRTSYEAGQRFLRETQGFDTVEALYMGNTNELGLPAALWEHSETSLEWITDHALRFIESNRDKPFFLWVAPNAPHGMAGQNFMKNSPRDTAAGRLAEDPEGMPGRDSLKKRIAESSTDPETTVSTWIDDSLGALLNKLEELGLAENTIVVFTSDHQSYGKWTCYEGSRVPFILRWKGKTGPPRVLEDQVSAVDLAPTLLDLCGITPPAPEQAALDGRSFAPLITDASSSLEPAPVFLEFGFGRAIVEGNWKYIALRLPPAIQERREQTGKMPRYHGEFGNSERESKGFPNYGAADQLYNLQEDKFEQNNLAGDQAHRAKLEDLRSKLKAKLQEIGLPFGEFVAANTDAKL